MKELKIGKLMMELHILFRKKEEFYVKFRDDARVIYLSDEKPMEVINKLKDFYDLINPIDQEISKISTEIQLIIDDIIK